MDKRIIINLKKNASGFQIEFQALEVKKHNSFSLKSLILNFEVGKVLGNLGGCSIKHSEIRKKYCTS